MQLYQPTHGNKKTTKNEDATVSSLWHTLEKKEWDMKSRLYLGFGSRRYCWTIEHANAEDKKDI